MNSSKGIYFPKILNGNIKTAPTNLNTTSSVKPTIRKGNRISQKIGSNTIKRSAIGQHMTRRMHHRRIAIMDLINSTNENGFQLLYFHF